MPKVIVETTFDEVLFRCQRCGSCCHHRRPPEFGDLISLDRLKEFWERSNLIYLTEKDVHDIGHRTGLDPDEFVDTLYGYRKNFVRVEDHGKKVILDLPVMKSKEDTTCVFYEEGCTVYTLRPRACRLFPFRVEEESTLGGDILLRISYNEGCPGIGKGGAVDKEKLKKLVVDQFVQRTEAIAPEVQRLRLRGSISRDARIYRTFPGRRDPRPQESEDKS